MFSTSIIKDSDLAPCSAMALSTRMNLRTCRSAARQTILLTTYNVRHRSYMMTASGTRGTRFSPHQNGFVRQNLFDVVPPKFCVRPACVTMATTTSNQIDPFSKKPLFHPTKGRLVYTGPLFKTVKKVKVFSLTTSIIGVSLQPYIYLNSSANIKVLFAVGGFLNFFVFLTPVIIHWITKRYVTDVYYNQDTGKFVAATISFLLRRKEVEFTADDVTVAYMGGMFTTHIVKGKPYLMTSDSFIDKEAYIHMVGYDKPMDFSVDPADVNKK